jgi:hypothetical protein
MDDLPTVTHEGVIKIDDLEITVMRLSNGQSVIEEHSFHKLMDAIFGGDTPKEEEAGNG